MKKLVLAIAVLSISAVSASAADLAPRVYTKAPARMPRPAFSWTGFYIGADVGYGAATSTGEIDNNTFVSSGNYAVHPGGVLGGGYVGGNYQINQFVLGLEADWQAAKLDGRQDNINPVDGPYSVFSKIRDYGSVRGRIGVAFDRWLVFGTGGGAWGSWQTAFEFTGFPPPFDTNKVSEHMGWTAGGGVEYAITDNVIARAEYRYTDLGTVAHDNFSANAADAGNHITINDARLGISYKFGGFGGPVVAKY